MLGTLTLVGTNMLAMAPIVWAPAAARTVTVTPAQPQPNAYGVQLTPNAALQLPAKGAADTLDFSLNLTDWLVPGDAIERCSVAINDTALALLSKTHSLTLASVWLAGGTPGGNASIDLTVTTATGRVGRFTLTLPIDPLTPAEQAGYNPPTPPLPPGTLLGRYGTSGPPEPLVMGPSFVVAGGVVDVDFAGAAGVTQEELTVAVLGEAQRAEGQEGSLQDQITTLAAATAALVTATELAAAILAETQRAEAAEAANAALVVAEAQRALGAEGQLQSEINTIQAGSGGGTIALPHGAALLSTDGAGGPLALALGANLREAGGALSVTRTGFPVNFHGFVASLPNVALPQVLLTIDVGTGEAAAFPNNLSGSVNKSNVAATSSYVISITKGGTVVATLTFAAGSTTATMATVSGTGFTVVAGDILQWVGPATPDATLAGIRLNLYGTVS